MQNSRLFFQCFFKFSSINLPLVQRCLMNFVGKWDLFCLFWWLTFTTDTIVYPCGQNQNQYENGLAPVNTSKCTFQKSDWFDRVKIRDLCERSLRWIFVTGAKVLAAVPSMSQPKEFTRTDLKLAMLGRSFQPTLKYRDLSRNGESHLFLAQLIIQFICCHCLVLIHVIVVQERKLEKAKQGQFGLRPFSMRFASVSIWLALTLA